MPEDEVLDLYNVLKGDDTENEDGIGIDDFLLIVSKKLREDNKEE